MVRVGLVGHYVLSCRYKLTKRVNTLGLNYNDSKFEDSE